MRVILDFIFETTKINYIKLLTNCSLTGSSWIITSSSRTLIPSCKLPPLFRYNFNLLDRKFTEEEIKVFNFKRKLHRTKYYDIPEQKMDLLKRYHLHFQILRQEDRENQSLRAQNWCQWSIQPQKHCRWARKEIRNPT